ncbi:MAG: CHAP domain-containing protein [Treponemataceae bacterium]|nr:CHAP domain-containing protein [Treponemataceae bacterium]
MTFETFIQVNKGKKVDFDGAYGAQCVDLFRQYCQDVLQIPHTGSCSTSGGAKDLFLDYDIMPLEKKYFRKMPFPFGLSFDSIRAGDVAVWNGTARNKYGHVAIVISVIGDSLVVFEQDGIAQDGAKINNRPTENLLGILRSVKEVA